MGDATLCTGPDSVNHVDLWTGSLPRPHQYTGHRQVTLTQNLVTDPYGLSSEPGWGGPSRVGPTIPNTLPHRNSSVTLNS